MTDTTTPDQPTDSETLRRVHEDWPKPAPEPMTDFQVALLDSQEEILRASERQTAALETIALHLSLSLIDVPTEDSPENAKNGYLALMQAAGATCGIVVDNVRRADPRADALSEAALAVRAKADAEPDTARKSGWLQAAELLEGME